MVRPAASAASGFTNLDAAVAMARQPLEMPPDSRRAVAGRGQHEIEPNGDDARSARTATPAERRSLFGDYSGRPDRARS